MATREPGQWELSTFLLSFFLFLDCRLARNQIAGIKRQKNHSQSFSYCRQLARLLIPNGMMLLARVCALTFVRSLNKLLFDKQTSGRSKFNTKRQWHHEWIQSIIIKFECQIRFRRCAIYTHHSIAICSSRCHRRFVEAKFNFTNHWHLEYFTTT